MGDSRSRNEIDQIDIMQTPIRVPLSLEPKHGSIWIESKRDTPTKLANVWHGPFRVMELYRYHAVRLDIAVTPYRFFSVVHVSKSKQVVKFTDWSNGGSMVENGDRVDFDESLQPKDS